MPAQRPLPSGLSTFVLLRELTHPLSTRPGGCGTPRQVCGGDLADQRHATTRSRRLARAGPPGRKQSRPRDSAPGHLRKKFSVHWNRGQKLDVPEAPGSHLATIARRPRVKMDPNRGKGSREPERLGEHPGLSPWVQRGPKSMLFMCFSFDLTHNFFFV